MTLFFHWRTRLWRANAAAEKRGRRGLRGPACALPAALPRCGLPVERAVFAQFRNVPPRTPTPRGLHGARRNAAAARAAHRWRKRSFLKFGVVPRTFAPCGGIRLANPNGGEEYRTGRARWFSELLPFRYSRVRTSSGSVFARPRRSQLGCVLVCSCGAPLVRQYPFSRQTREIKYVTLVCAAERACGGLTLAN